MARYAGLTLAQDYLVNVAGHVVQAALKASQLTGRLKLQAEVITGEDLEPIIELMSVMAKASQFVTWDYMTFKQNYERGTPPVLVLLGADTISPLPGWNCGACGFATCGEFARYAKENRAMGQVAYGPSCNWLTLDLAIAADWACAAAWQFNVDNRIQGSSGSAATLLGYLPGCTCILGLPLGPCREMVWYSREDMHHHFHYEDHLKTMFQTIPTHFLAFSGSGRPQFKAQSRWWEEAHFHAVGPSQAAAEKMYALLEEMAEVIDRHSAAVASRYTPPGQSTANSQTEQAEAGE
ncbi:MAG: DUF2148 domain-containing protein [Desulfurispora sp.]|uniref:DUF2148 domain-containing protein n=1 Tax=Desulfurispora sp. TaxID=3014275 RepID=UPI0040498A4E